MPKKRKKSTCKVIRAGCNCYICDVKLTYENFTWDHETIRPLRSGMNKKYPCCHTCNNVRSGLQGIVLAILRDHNTVYNEKCLLTKLHYFCNIIRNR